MVTRSLIVGAILAAASTACAPVPEETSTAPEASAAVTGTVESGDGVPIAYSSGGTGKPALVFIHGGFADQSFWSKQVESLGDRFQTVTLDLAGHGASGRKRSVWSVDAFGEDVRAVVEALGVDSVVLVGNSLGGLVSLSAAKKLPKIVRAIIAVDTLQDADQERSREELEAFIQTLRDDFPSACRAMVRQLLLEATDAELYAWIETKMCAFDASIAPRIVDGVLDYDLKAEFAAAQVPIRGILGEITSLDLKGNRELQPDFDAVIMEGCGHYPMLERPKEFNRHLVAYVEELGSR